MNGLYILNYIILATFVALFSVEIGIACLAIFTDKKKSKITKGFSHLWGIVTTFAVFFLVNFEAIYPRFLVNLGTIYEIPLLIIAALMVVRNSFIVYAYFFDGNKNERLFQKIYAAATIIIALFTVGILTSIGTGNATNLQSNTLNLFSLIINPFTILAFIGLALISTVVARGYLFPVEKKKARSTRKYKLDARHKNSASNLKQKKFFFNREQNLKAVNLISFIIGIVLIFTTISIYMPLASGNFMNNLVLIILEAIILLIVFISIIKEKYYGWTTALWILISLILFGIAQFPNILGGKENITQYLATNPTMAISIMAITAFGYLLILTAFYIMKKFL